MIHELRVVDGDGAAVRLALGSEVAITVDGSESYSGRVVDSDQGGATQVDFDDETYAAYRAAAGSKLGPRFRTSKRGRVSMGSRGRAALTVTALRDTRADHCRRDLPVKQYVLKHPKREHCKAHYVRKSKTVGEKVHGHRIEVRETVCESYVMPAAASPAPSPAPTPTPTPASPPCPPRRQKKNPNRPPPSRSWK